MEASKLRFGQELASPVVSHEHAFAADEQHAIAPVELKLVGQFGTFAAVIPCERKRTMVFACGKVIADN